MQKVVLLVDDEPVSLHALEKIFTGCDYQIITSNNGHEALKVLSQSVVHVIIIDLKMPIMSGVELLAEVKKSYPDTIRLVSSASTDFKEIKDAVNQGFIFKFLSKPWDINFLHEAVRESFQLYANHNKKKCLAANGIFISDSELQNAIEKNQFLIYYQPIILADTGKIIGAEALLRWQHPTLGLLEPIQFISLCEDLGFIIPIGNWVLRTACQQLKEWHLQGHKNLHMAVNLSVNQFNHPRLIELITEVLVETQIPANCLELEMTESAIMKNRESNIMQLQALRNLGAQLSIDDFGTGYSSLSYLREFPINTLKIDKSFIQDITVNPNIIEILSMIINLAKKLNLTIIAEGVETKEQLEKLKENQCEMIQGYLFSKPLTKAEFTQLLTTNS